MAGRSSRLTEAAVIDFADEVFAADDPAVRLGIGDDAAVLSPEPGGSQLVTTDTLVEGVHFDLRYMRLYEVGWKALAVSISDIAAMGGIPRHAVAQLGLPPAASRRGFKELSRGVSECAGKYSVRIVGGDTFAAPQWQLGFTLLGRNADSPVLRSGARAGDLVWLCGLPGLSQTGLHLLWARLAGLNLGRSPAYRHAKRAHALPMPAVETGIRLAEFGATAAIDTSDSLAQSLLHIAGQSAVGLRLDFRNFHFDEAITVFAAACRKLAGLPRGSAGFRVPALANPEGTGLDFSSLAHYLLYSSEDYGLVVTAPPAMTSLIERGCSGLRQVGQVLPVRHGCRYIDETGAQHELTGIGWQHR